MFLKIDGKDTELKFGFKFIRTLDTLLADEKKKENVSALDSVVIELKSENLSILPVVVKAGLSHLEELPTDDQIDEALELKAEEMKGKSICLGFIELLEEAPLLSKQVTKMSKMMDKLLSAQDKAMDKQVEKALASVEK